jgi:hypothetical protein
MVFSKLRSGLSAACVIALAGGLTFAALPAASQEQQQVPAEGAQPAPDQATPDQAVPPPAAPADAGGGDGAAPPAAEAPAQPQDAAPPPSAEQPQDSAAPQGDSAQPADSGAAQAPPAQPEQPAAEGPPAAQPAEGGAAVNATQIQIGAAVFGADGAQIGEVNGVKSDDSGKVTEILVTNGTPAGMNAKVFEVTADKITSAADTVKLSLSSEEAKKLPIIDNGNG